MLQKMDSKELSPEELPPTSARGVPDDVMDPDLDDDLAASLCLYSPQYQFWQASGEVCDSSCMWTWVWAGLERSGGFGDLLHIV